MGNWCTEYLNEFKIYTEGANENKTNLNTTVIIYIYIYIFINNYYQYIYAWWRTYRLTNLFSIDLPKWTDIQGGGGGKWLIQGHQMLHGQPINQSQSLQNTLVVCVNLVQGRSVTMSSIRYTHRRSQDRNIPKRCLMADILVYMQVEMFNGRHTSIHAGDTINT